MSLYNHHATQVTAKSDAANSASEASQWHADRAEGAGGDWDQYLADLATGNDYVQRANNELAAAAVIAEDINPYNETINTAHANAQTLSDEADVLLARYESGSQLHWKALSVNARGQVTSYQQGEHITTNRTFINTNGLLSSVLATTGAPYSEVSFAPDGGGTNLGFEADTLAEGAWTLTPSAWQGVGSSGAFSPDPVHYPSEVPQGSNIGFANSGARLSQTLTDTFDKALDYTLSVEVAGRADQTGTGSYAVRLLAGSLEIGQATGSVAADGVFETVTVVVHANTAGLAGVGQALKIELVNTGASVQLGFDNVQLEASLAPDGGGTNLDFEADTLAEGAWTLTPSAWQGVGSHGAFNPGPVHYPSEAPQGSNVGFANSGTQLSQTLAGTFDEALDYTLSVELAGRADQTGTGSYAVRLLAGSLEIGQATGSVAADGVFETVTVAVHANTAGLAGVGQALKIELVNTGASVQLGFDNVQLEVSLDSQDHRALVAADNVIQNDSYVWDALGNLLERTNNVAGINSSGQTTSLTETFTYDALNRMITSDLSGSGADIYQLVGLAMVDYSYSANGNLTRRSDLGYLNYDHLSKAHAVTSVDNGNRYTYDANGNMTEMVNGSVERDIDYTPFDKPKQIEGADGSTTELFYGPERQLIREAVSGGVSTLHLGGYEKIIDGSTTTHRYSVTGHNGETVAMIIDDTAPTTHYLHLDHLGSISAISDSSGYVLERFHYDAFGKQRLAINASLDGTPQGLNTDITRRGYTGHLELSTDGLTYMNARVYDSTLGRFMSADTIVPNPFHSQDFNRYSYVRNNPLRYTDPTGHWPGGCDSYYFPHLDCNFNNIDDRYERYDFPGGDPFGRFPLWVDPGSGTGPLPSPPTNDPTTPNDDTSDSDVRDGDGNVTSPVSYVPASYTIGARNGGGLTGQISVNDIAGSLIQVSAHPNTVDLGPLEDYVGGIFSAWVDAGRTIITAGSVFCEGFSSTCARQVEHSRRIGRAVGDYRNDARIREQVDRANDAAMLLILSDPSIGRRAAGRVVGSAILGPFGILVAPGGALRASEQLGDAAQVNDFIQGVIIGAPKK